MIFQSTAHSRKSSLHGGGKSNAASAGEEAITIRENQLLCLPGVVAGLSSTKTNILNIHVMQA